MLMQEICFLKNHEENQAARLVQDLFLFFDKALCEGTTNVYSP